MKIALRVSVNTNLGFNVGVPNLKAILKKYGANATFFIPMHQDSKLRSLKLFWQLAKLGGFKSFSANIFDQRTSAPEKQTWVDIIKILRKEGFEVGVSSFSCAEWYSNSRTATAKWIKKQYEKANLTFQEILEESPISSGAPFFQMNREAYRQNQKYNFRYTSDTIGFKPFIPIYEGEIIACPQIPVTLPKITDLLVREKLTCSMALSELEKRILTQSHNIYDVTAEIEGIRLIDIFEKLLNIITKKTKIQIVSLIEYLESSVENLPQHELKIGVRSCHLKSVDRQGSEFLA